MSEPITADVRAECRTLTLYLAGFAADELVTLSYARGLVSDAFTKAAGDASLDRALLSLARRGPFAAGLADAWARCFAPAGQLRRRLVLLVAILESTAPGYIAFEPAARGRFVAFVTLFTAGLGFVARLVVALPVVAIARRLESGRSHERATAEAGSGRTT